MARILVVAPYEGLKDLFLEVTNELKKEVHVEVGDLYKGLSIAKELEDKGYDVIISRGATAHLLRKHCSLPVVEVKITGYDILRTLTLLRGYSGKIGLMSYFNTIQGADVIGTLLEMNLSFFPINEESEIEIGIKKALKEDVQVIIGDVITTSVATSFGLNAILIASGREAVEDSIYEAEQIEFYTKKEKVNREFFESIIKGYPEGLIGIDRQGNIQLLNDKAEKFMGLKESEITGQKLIKVIPQLYIEDLFRSNLEPSETICILGGEQYVLKRLPLKRNRNILGDILILEETKEIQRIESRIRRSLFTNSAQPKMHFNNLVAINKEMKRQISAANELSKVKTRILIYGEPGTGKQSLAQAIHNESVQKDFPFVFLNCEAYSEQQLEKEIFGFEGDEQKQGVFEAAHNGTLFIDAIGQLPLSIQAKLINVLTENKVTRINGTHAIPVNVRIISANSSNLNSQLETEKFREDLFHLINEATLSIPALRYRPEDMSELVLWFIASFNARLGKQIVGVRPEVMNQLKQAKWPGNIQQLKNIIERMCMETTGSFIEKSDVRTILDELFLKNDNSDLNSSFINIDNKTLGELEKEIINQVMEEEGFKQSRAAKRLGINRSTLWRKIKEATINNE
ncbi:sigma-54-dependent Fis family transcriptional regulator [Domibacillus enclensis]|uniref:PAS domain S-box-containing protein n=1 Tax=Domibacillus enclensis TaxID=1017273 RepID=A0A1N6SG80_9BACI|nr:sigma-54-dependent Fis family transcriptional regulator [Domibacillus enclensis]OXS79318.1 sigma-54-dependent Fis family transcriptional regulator [Domibacillus enclensis]SIQ40060.1 PAS domain S-box-containing protein [Domibacillus enclensis]